MRFVLQLDYYSPSRLLLLILKSIFFKKKKQRINHWLCPLARGRRFIWLRYNKAIGGKEGGEDFRDKSQPEKFITIFLYPSNLRSTYLEKKKTMRDVIQLVRF
jgi:hypothetical protein